jgi:hemolysin III
MSEHKAFLSDNDRPQTLGEEIANAISHGVGFLAAAIGGPFLIYVAVKKGEPISIVSAAVFISSVLLLYLASTLYHCLPRNTAKRVFQVFDHIGIFLLIAGTYTPFAFGVLRGTLGWIVFGVIWGIALLGIVTKVVPRLHHEKVSLALYLGMGWLSILIIRPLWQHLPLSGFIWLIAGGVAYTAGTYFYAADKMRYGHFIWHLFTIAGTTCHFLAILCMMWAA